MGQHAYFGRAWQVSVTNNLGNQTGEPFTLSSADHPALRIQFEISTWFRMVAWQARLVIYNLSSGVSTSLSRGSAFSLAQSRQLDLGQALDMGGTVKISAGYELTEAGAFNAANSLLYTGNILQAYSTIEGVVDTKLTLNCLTHLVLHSYSKVGLNAPEGSSDLTILQAIVEQAKVPKGSNYIDPVAEQALAATKYPKGQVVFDQPIKKIADIVSQRNLFAFMDDNSGLTIRSGDFFVKLSQNEPPKVAYGPANWKGAYTSGTTMAGLVKPTLIGTPEQTQEGVRFRVLMDSQVRIGDMVQLAPALPINRLNAQFNAVPARTSRNGVYFVKGLRHYGDSRGRGNDWYTEIEGVTPAFFPTFLGTLTQVALQ